MFVFAEERELRNGSIHLRIAFAIREATEPPPTFPFLESQCQRAAFRREFSFWQRSNTARKASPAGGVGAVYRGANRLCQTLKTKFFERLWMTENGPFSPHFQRRDQDPKPLRNVVREPADTRDSGPERSLRNFIAERQPGTDLFSRESIGYGTFCRIGAARAPGGEGQ